MAVPFKKVGYRKDPKNKNSEIVFHPRLVTMGQTMTLESIAYEMKEKSSLSYGDIKSVLTNFVEAMRTALYNGHSVNIQEFGVFSLSAHSAGVADVKDCTSKNIRTERQMAVTAAVATAAATAEKKRIRWAKNPPD